MIGILSNAPPYTGALDMVRDWVLGCSTWHLTEVAKLISYGKPEHRSVSVFAHVHSLIHKMKV
jgi:hypothetical protein